MALLVCAVAAGGCTGSRRASPEPTMASKAATPSPSSTGAPPVTFGDLASPCGSGNATGATDQGVTDTTIRIGYGDDRGFPQSPGLNQQVGDAIRGLIKWCNDQGGILGRKVQGDFYDAAVLQANAVTGQACKVDFMLVGEGWGLDEAAEGTRVACNLAAVPAFTIGADFANGPMMYQAVPNPVDYLPASPYYQMAMLFPGLINKTDVIHSTLAQATEVAYNKDLEAMGAAGWTNVHCGVTINYLGEPDYK